ncbi:c-type cytochrome [Marivivens aquimaris]|uniref:c-type cytochrome n=1 Tax=Marivivens aquimaris TaxID=2774876 RepID=UPI0018812458|nr:c-type cytochrome [Marivivens aquimaris]
MKYYLFGGAAIAAIAGAAFFTLAPYNIAASVPHFPLVGEVLHQYLRNAVTVRASHIEVPEQVDLSDPGLIRLGAGHFATSCQMCHGAPGIERNPVVEHMRPAPPPLDGDDYDPEEFWWIARHGFKYTGMPSWVAERDDEPWAMAAFLSHYNDFDRTAYEEAAFGEAGSYSSEAISFTDGLPNTCTRCHGEDGMGRDGAAPIVSGQTEGYLIGALMAYGNGQRQSGFMQPLAKPLEAIERARVAQGMAAGSTEWNGIPLPFGDAERGGELANRGSEPEDIAACSSCHEGHGENGLYPERGDVPRIAGQHGYFLYNWLMMYRDGPIPTTERAHLMAAAAKPLTDEDIADLAAYYSSVR